MSLDEQIDEMENTINEDNIKHALRHLFEKVDAKQIPLKTELDDNEIKAITKLKTIAGVMDIKVLDSVLINFMELRISSGRKGRSEIIDALKQIADNKTGARAFNGMFGQWQKPGGVIP